VLKVSAIARLASLLVFFWNILTAESAEDTEEEKREMNNSDINGFDITHKRK